VHSHQVDDDADIARVLAGDVEAFRGLVERHQDRILGHLRRLAGTSQAEDLCQETFVRAFSALAGYDRAYPFRGWLLVIASRLAMNHRARIRPGRLDEEMLPVDPSSPDPAEHAEASDERAYQVRQLESALASLSAEDRDLYELRFRQELSVAEIAGHHGIAENAINVRIHRLRQRLIAILRPALENA
jgi:RNA polymerase sigma factor (sigma-70 family)